MKTAKLVKKLEGTLMGGARLFELSEPVGYDYGETEKTTKETNFVIVSAVSNYITTETYIFPADSEGNILDLAELDGSYKGDASHKTALIAAGYTVL